MENVINVNIGRVSFVLNLEAYTILEKYLKELSDHYKSSSYGEEIMEDIESRIAELLLEKYSKDEVVNSQRIEEIIAIMGQPSDYYASEENEEREADNKSSASAESSFENHSVSTPIKKRLFRDVQNKYIGGVCSGFGHFFSIDPTWIRIALVLLVIFLKVASNKTIFDDVFDGVINGIVLLYIIFWIFIPRAKTYTQKCSMLGRDPGVKGAEGIDGTETFYDRPGSTMLEKFFRWVIGLVMVLLGFGFLIYGIVMFGVLKFFEGTAITNDYNFALQDFGLLTIISLVVVWVIPCILLIYEGIRVIGKLKSPSWHPGLIMLIVWIISISVLLYSLLTTGKEVFEKIEWNSVNWNSVPGVTVTYDSDKDYEVIVDTLPQEVFEDAVEIIEADSVRIESGNTIDTTNIQ